MTNLIAQHDAAVIECLRRHADTFEPAGPGRWELGLAGGQGAICATVAMEQDWLLFNVAPGDPDRQPRPSTERLGELLQANARLPGGVKFALDAVPPRVLLAAEIPLHEQVDVDGQVSDVRAGLRQGVIEFTRQQGHDTAEPKPPKTAPADENLQAEAPPQHEHALVDLCREAGWPCTERAGGHVAVTLDAGRAFTQAIVEPAGQASYRAWVELGANPSPSDTTSHAVNWLLLLACRVVRMARAVAVPAADGRVAYGWEVVLGRSPAAGELHDAFSALSVACRLTRREIHALQEESVAQKYLAARGWSSPRSAE